MSTTTEDFTRGEWLWVNRRRAGRSVAEQAAKYHVSEDRYRTWERDRVPQEDIPRLKHTPMQLTPGEYAALMRRRKGWSIAKVARMRKTTKVTMIKQEHDRTRTAGELAAWWRNVWGKKAPLYFPSTST